MRKTFFIVALAMIIIDQATKVWARGAANWTEGHTFLVPWPGVFEFKLVYNRGIAFGMFQGAGVWLAPAALVIAVGAAWYSVKHRDEPRSSHITMALLFAGAIGNLIDRVAFNQVTDLFYLRVIDFPVFNVADVCITAAGFLLALGAFGEIFAKKPPEPPSESAPSATEETNL